MASLASHLYIRMSCQDVMSGCHVRMSCQDVMSGCHVRMSCQDVMSGCHVRMSCMLHVHITLACVRDPDVPTLPATSMALMRGLLCRPRRVGASRLGAKQLNLTWGPSVEILLILIFFPLDDVLIDKAGN